MQGELARCVRVCHSTPVQTILETKAKFVFQAGFYCGFKAGLFFQRFSTALRAANRRKIEFSEKFLEFSEKFLEFSKKILECSIKTLEFRENSSRLIEISILLHQLSLGFSKCTLENICQTSMKNVIL